MDDTSGNGAAASGRFGSLAVVVGYIGAGAITLAVLILGVDTVADLPVSRTVGLGLGVALGGGLGAVVHFLQTADDAEIADETMTVDVDDSSVPAPQPADLFDGHPDPVLYYANEGHGPVIRAANEAFAATFGVPADQLAGTPLSEAVLVTGAETAAETQLDTDGFDAVVTCETDSGAASFRLRTVASETSGYVLYTPLDD
ncbi:MULTISPECIES: hypothetical protein [Haloarcula]|uniref:hypothetical protein n=1 Tax=Haloarcula TaxID=2237 RepID=UPI001E550458|nr:MULTISPECIES: hypothetical protein [Halomicroarcula]MDS0278273.1 hypothetical protein [Halomicroarcula sp. S1AR25-4]